jgi:hypothetical protein
VLNPLFSSIPATGQITSDISFQFEEGPGGLTFPGQGGIVASVTGVASYKGTAYSGPNPPTLAVPAMPAAKDLAYSVSDYTFNSLMWAFYAAGSLARHVVPGDLPDPAGLNTSTYKDSPLQAHYNAYPDLAMTAAIVANAAPTVVFEEIYNLSAAAYATLSSQLPATVYKSLNTIVGSAFLTESDFAAELANVLGAGSAGEYATIIGAAAQVFAGIVAHDNRVTLSVVQSGKEIPVIIFDVTQTDVLEDFALGASGAAQTLGFAFQIIPDLTRTTFVSSTIAGIDSGDFSFIWNWSLQKVYATEVAAIGKAGVALPRIPNFDFLFDEAEITLHAGYANVVTDVQHTGDAGRVAQLAAKLAVKTR